MKAPARRIVVIAMLVLLAAVSTACSIESTSVTVDVRREAAVIETERAGASGLEPIGPIPGSSHWHAAYIVRVCDDVLVPFDSAESGLGIHSHADGLIHVHPFVAEAGYEAATLAVFADAMGLGLSTGELVLPGGGAWRDGDLCNGVEGRVFVDRWQGPGPTGSVERIFVDPQDLRFEGDGELYQIAFAPADSPPVVPPSLSLLPEVMPPPRADVDPWITVDASADVSTAVIAVIDESGDAPCSDGQIPSDFRGLPEVCFSLGAELAIADAVAGAAPGHLNREPAVDLMTTAEFRRWLLEAFAAASPADGVGLAFVVDGRVVTAPVLARPPVSLDRLVLVGGFDVESATTLAALFDSAN